MDVREFLKGEDFKFLKWVEIITDERDAVKLSAMYILQKDLNTCDIIFVSDKGKKRKASGVSKESLQQDFTLLDLSNLSEENKAVWKEELGLGLSIINFTIDDDMHLHLEIQENSGLDFSLDQNGHLILNN